MRHPRIDLRTIHGPHVADGTRFVMLELQGETIARLEPPPERRLYARSPEAQDRRRHRGTRPEA